jgi:hypothetical protein
MRELDGRRLPRRVVGRQAIMRSLALTAIRLARFAEHRAVAPSEHGWSARVATALQTTLVEASRST